METRFLIIDWFYSPEYLELCFFISPTIKKKRKKKIILQDILMKKWHSSFWSHEQFIFS